MHQRCPMSSRLFVSRNRHHDPVPFAFIRPGDEGPNEASCIPYQDDDGVFPAQKVLKGL